MPIYVSAAEVVDPLILDAKIVEPHHHCGCGCELSEVPNSICQMFGQDIVLNNNCRRLFVTLGQFCIIRLERDIQLLMPAYDICMPERDCSCGGGGDPEDPCDVFDRFEFSVDEFFPPRREPSCDCGCGCGCGCEPDPCHDFAPGPGGCGVGSGSCGSSGGCGGSSAGGCKRKSCC